MFGMSFGEILVIAIIAILFVGPDKLPEMMMQIAKFFRSFKKGVNDVKESIEQEVHLQELKEEAISYREQLEKSVKDIKEDKEIDVIDSAKEEILDIKKSLTKLEDDSFKGEKKNV